MVYTVKYPETLFILLKWMELLPKIRNFSGVAMNNPSSFFLVFGLFKWIYGWISEYGLFRNLGKI